MTDIDPQPSSRRGDEALSPGKQQPPDGPDRNRQASSIAIVLGLVFFLFLVLGYQTGKDLATRENHADCVAAGNSDCS